MIGTGVVLAKRIIAAAGLLAIPALLAVASQVLAEPAEAPAIDETTIVVELAPSPDAETVPESADEDPKSDGSGQSPQAPGSGSPSVVNREVIEAPVTDGDDDGLSDEQEAVDSTFDEQDGTDD